MKIRSFSEIYKANKIFLENLPFHVYISMELDTNGKFPCHAYMDMPRDNGEYTHRVMISNPAGIF
jgi:hypothetical protein